MKNIILRKTLGNSEFSEENSNIPIFGMVLENEDEGKKGVESATTYEPLVIWLVRGTNNSKTVNAFIRGDSKYLAIGQTNVGDRDVNNQICEVHTYGNISLQTSVDLDNYVAKQEVYANTFKVGNLIFVPKEMNLLEEFDFILKTLSQIFKERFPVPVKKEWESEVFQRLVSKLIELPIVGDIPFKKVLKINFKVDLFKEIIVEEYSKWQFKNKFNFIPQITSLLYLLDLNKFNPKKWQNFLVSIGGKENFEIKSKSEQINLVYFFEVFQEKSFEILSLLKEFELKHKEKGAIKLENINFHSIAKDLLNTDYFMVNKAFESIKGVIKYMEDQDKISKMRLNSTLIFKKMFEVITDYEFYSESINSPSKFYKEIISVNYKDIDPRCQMLALKASELLLKYEDYKLYEDEYIKNIQYIKEDARYFPTIKGVMPNEDYTWECIDMDDPNAWFVGLETNCCQHLTSAGKTCVLFMAKNPGKAGVFRLMKKGVTIAQSFIWIDTVKQTLVFDNIEFLGEKMQPIILEAYREFCSRVSKIKIFTFVRFTIGLGYNGGLSGLEKLAVAKSPSLISELRNVRDIGVSVYSDAKQQVVLR